MNSIKLKIENKKAKIGVIGLGYVGLPLVSAFSIAGFNVTGFDVDMNKISMLNKGESYIKHLDIRALHKSSFTATNNFSNISKMNIVIICVPTPLTKHKNPDLKYITSTSKTISKFLKKDQLIILESTTYPGTTDEVMIPLLEKNEKKLKAGTDFHVAFSPEREDPGNKKFSIGSIPKVVGGITPFSTELTCNLYNFVVKKTIPVSSTKVAEASKILENIYRSVNIALVNELKILFDKMKIDIWEVIFASSTKPFGFQPFYPGPGLGGHCIPIDPFYLTW
ncbi:MAG: nucleotide sugar dehydrogenase, partial [Candidatus Aureabacteria bacterium]|nr:nucleotide sugar dehydrogenase [Candidatus Auribacterota bacterium]